MKQIVSKLVRELLVIEQRARKKQKKSNSEFPLPDTELQTVDIVSQRLNPPVEGFGITHPFGEKRKFGKTHHGVDFNCTNGTPVYAIKDGTVVTSTTQMNKLNRNIEAGWGRYIIIEHTDFDNTKFYSLYAHLSKVFIQSGQEIKSGDQLGLSGGIEGAPGSGNSEGAHLHFEIKTSISGGEIDPVKFYEDRNQTIFTKLGTPKSISNDTPYDVLDQLSTVTPDAGSNQSTAVTSTSNININTTKTGDIKDGYNIYRLPGDERYIYGIPLPTQNFSYGWWTFINDSNKWLELKTHLSTKNYKIATNLLNNTFPFAIDPARLTNNNTTNTDTNTTDNTSTDRNDNNDNKVTDKFAKYTKNTIYKPNLILNKSNIPLYSYNATSKKFTKSMQGNDQLIYQIEAGEKVQYVGKSSDKKYAFLKFIDSSNDPAGSYWVEEKYIK